MDFQKSNEAEMKNNTTLNEVEQFQRFMEAVADGNIAEMDGSFIPSFINKEEEEVIKRRPLHIAVLYQQLDAMFWLLNHGADINNRDEREWLPIHYGGQEGLICVLEALVVNGADVNSKGENGNTAMHYAAMKGHIGAMKVLLNNGGDINQPNQHGMTPLHTAAQSGMKTCVEWLLTEGANPNEKDRWHDRPIDKAALNGHTTTVDLLRQIMNGGDTWVTPFLAAVCTGRSDEVKQMLDKDSGDIVDVNEPADKSGLTVMHLAAKNGHVEIMAFLMGRGANIEAEDIEKVRPFNWACRSGRTEAVRWLVETAGCVLDGKNRDGRTPMDEARRYGYEDCFEIIENELARRQKDEFQIFHLPTFTVINRKYKIYDLTNAVEKIKMEISCINRPIVLCYLADPFKLPSLSKAFRMIGEGLQYPEYFVADLQQNKEDLQPQVSKLRDWNVRVTVNTSALEIKLEIERQADPSKWSHYVAVSLDLLNEPLQSVTDTIHMLVMENTKGADLKEAFIDFQRFVYSDKLFASFDSQQPHIHDGIQWLRMWILTQKELLRFYHNDREKLLNSSSIIASGIRNYGKVFVVYKAPKNVEFIPPLSESSWSKQFVSKALSQKHILIRCITDDDLAWILPRTDLINAGHVRNRLLPFVVDDSCGGSLLLVGPKGELTDDTEINDRETVIHYTVIFPKQKVEKFGNIGRGSYGLVLKCKMKNDEKIFAMKIPCFLDIS